MTLGSRLRNSKSSAAILLFIFSIIIVSLAGCSGSQPMLPDDVAEEIEQNLGYALAPTWLPEGFDYSGPSIHDIAFDQTYGDPEIVQGYSKIVSLEETAQLVLSYPAPDVNPPSLESAFAELVPPDDAVSEIEINGAAASLVTGTWSKETLQRIQKVELPLDPEWDYNGGYSLRFSIDVPGQNRVPVSLFTVFAAAGITGDDLVRIARSVVVD